MSIHQFKFIVQGAMPKLESLAAVTRVGEFTMFVGKIGTRSIAGIHIPKSAFEYSENNTYRSNVKYVIEKLFGDWIGFGEAQSATIGWTNYPSIATYENCLIQSCTFTDGMNEFAILSSWIRKVLSWPLHQQKSGWPKHKIDSWLEAENKKKRRVKNVPGTSAWRSPRSTEGDARSD